MERSLQEKMIYAQIRDEQEPLNYPLRKQDGEQVYEIPDEAKPEILKSLWPFLDTPDMTDVMFDLHEGKNFTVSDFLVIRFRKRNMIVSPYYFSKGGTCLDWVKPDDDGEEIKMELKKIKQ